MIHLKTVSSKLKKNRFSFHELASHTVSDGPNVTHHLLISSITHGQLLYSYTFRSSHFNCTQILLLTHGMLYFFVVFIWPNSVFYMHLRLTSVTLEQYGFDIFNL
jgi:hypothetical protein